MQNTSAAKIKRDHIAFWSPLVAHFTLSLAITLLVVLGVNGYKALAFPEQSRTQPAGGRYRYVFRVSDITTLLSASTKLMDVMVAAWMSLAGWRCAMVLMEKSGLKIQQISGVVGGWPWAPVARRPWPWGRGHRVEWLVALILLCLLPQPFIEPLFSGSVDWNVSFDYQSPVTVNSKDPTAKSSVWFWYNRQGIDRKNAIRRAGGVASSTWAAFDSQQSQDGAFKTPGGIACRHVTPNSAPVNSTLRDATLPCIYIHDIAWSDQPPANDDDAWDYASSKADDLSAISDGPFGYVRSGVAAVYSKELWDSPFTVEYDVDNSIATFPKPTKWSGKMTVLLLLGRQDAVGCKPISDNAFGNTSYITDKVKGVFQAHANAYDENCMAWGTVTFTAGAIKAPESTYVTDRVVEYYPVMPDESGQISAAQELEVISAIQPSIWTRDALWTLSDGMTQIAVMNTSLLPTWENLDNYTGTLLKYAYLSNWDMLHASFEDTDAEQQTLLAAEPRLQASVSFARVFPWFCITTLVPLTGFLLRFLHRSCARAMINDPIAALFIDSAEMVNEAPSLTAMTVVGKRHKEMRAIVLEGEPRGEEGGGRYFRLRFKDLVEASET
jgi:hypothetical protein